MQELTKIHKEEVKTGQDAHQISGDVIFLCYTSAVKRQLEIVGVSLSKVIDSW